MSRDSLKSRFDESLDTVVGSWKSLITTNDTLEANQNGRALVALKTGRYAIGPWRCLRCVISRGGSTRLVPTRASKLAHWQDRHTGRHELLAAEARIHAQRWRCINIRPGRLPARPWSGLPKRRRLLITARRAADMRAADHDILALICSLILGCYGEFRN